MKTIRVTKITKQEAINHERREYNSSAWKRIIELYSKDECSFYMDDTDVYAIYIADGIRFCQKISYAMCLSGGGIQQGAFSDNMIIFINAGGLANDSYNRNIMRQQTKKYHKSFIIKKLWNTEHLNKQIGRVQSVRYTKLKSERLRYRQIA